MLDKNVKNRSMVYYANVPRVDPSFKELRNLYLSDENNVRWRSVNIGTEDPDEDIPLDVNEFESDVTTVCLDDISSLSTVGRTHQAHIRKSLLAL